ncbi:hypothetical protein FRC06_003041, partial [Ceratobasidium sp. 370]
MGKSGPLLRCPYCDKGCRTAPGIERHISQKAECQAMRLKERNRHAGTKPTQAQRGAQPQATPLTVELGSNSALPPNADKEMQPAGQSKAQFGNDAHSPCRTPPPTLEGEDEVMATPPRWGPHPFAKRTRHNLFPKPHPDPTAGAPLRFEPIDKRVPPLYTSKLADPETFEEAYWLDHIPIPLADEEKYFKFPRNQSWHWRSVSELDTEILNLPRGPRWYCETKIIKGDRGEEILDLWKRDIGEMIVWILRNRRFLGCTRYAPERIYDSPMKERRIYGEMWTGDWWWRLQNILGAHATIAPIILSSDKTKMTEFNGKQKAWPVYISLGNISKDVRRRPSERATLLIGFIPVTDLSIFSDPKERSERGWELFHSCMESILEPLKVLSRTGMEVLCADGGVRRVFPILAAYIADFPEQVTIACVRDSRCPICWVPHAERGNLSARYPLRDRGRTLDALDDHWNGYSRTINTLGIRPTRPFWRDLPHVNISGCFTPDMLHQIHKGVLGDHLLKWSKALLGENAINHRTQGMPRFQKLRHFAQGISVISQWTGTEAKALASTLLTIVAGYEDPRLVVATRCIVDFAYRAHLPEISEYDLEMMERDLETLDRVKGVFVDGDIEGLLANESRFHGIPKLHMLTHYVFLIRELGAIDGYSTEITERLHIDCVKEPWRTTNHVNPLPQMITYLQKKEAWALLRAYMHDTGLVIDTRFQQESDDDDGDDDDEADGENDRGDGNDGAGDDDDEEGPQETVDNRGDDVGDGTWQPTPSISIAKRPALGRKRGRYLIEKHRAVDLVPATVEYLRHISTSAYIPLSEESYFKLWRRCKLHHHRLPFYPVLEPQTDFVRAFPPNIDAEGRVLRQGFFDVVLFSPTSDDRQDKEGIHRLEAGRVRAIFELPKHLRSTCSEKLVYLERFEPFSERRSRTTDLYTTRHAVHNGRRAACVVPLSRVPCHTNGPSTAALAPPTSSPLITHSTMMDSAATGSAISARSVHIPFASTRTTTPPLPPAFHTVPANSAFQYHDLPTGRSHSSAARSAFSSTNSSDVRALPTTLPSLPGPHNSSKNGRFTRRIHAYRPANHTAVHDSDSERERELDATPEITNLGRDEESRRRHIVSSEQRRRDQLREGFARLKNMLPASTEKCSKLNLLDRATTYVGYLRETLRQTQEELTASKVEVA